MRSSGVSSCLVTQDGSDTDDAVVAVSTPTLAPPSALPAATYRDIFTFWVTSPSLILLCLMGGIRNAGGYVWAYQCKNYFKGVRNVSDESYSIYMLWIPLLGGSMGAILGGFISDKFVRKCRTVDAWRCSRRDPVARTDPPPLVRCPGS